MKMADAMVIGGGPAGTSAAVLLAEAGWNVVLAEQNIYPRQKVCGECLPAGAFPLLDELGVGDQVRQLAGPELRAVGWMDSGRTLLRDMPACATTAEPYGRAIGRDVLDALLMARARVVGVDVRQPARVTAVRGAPGNFLCKIAVSGRTTESINAAVIVDAHGSWERGPVFAVPGALPDPADQPARASDLLAFKATFARSALAPGVLPVISLPGGYGGMVVSNGGRTTVALCLRRDALRAVRSRHRGVPAGIAIERYLRDSCPGAADALREGARQGAWLAVGPLRPGFRPGQTPGIYRVGNACAEAHPLVGEGIRMALQSSRTLARNLMSGERWREDSHPRLRLAACYAHIAMRPFLAAPVGRIMQHWPSLLTAAAVLAGKARASPSFNRVKELA
jgi:menaquinone-9 beta-reductase